GVASSADPVVLTGCAEVQHRVPQIVIGLLRSEREPGCLDHHGHGSRHMWRGHRRAIEVLISAAGSGAADVDPRGREVGLEVGLARPSTEERPARRRAGPIYELAAAERSHVVVDVRRADAERPPDVTGAPRGPFKLIANRSDRDYTRQEAVLDRIEQLRLKPTSGVTPAHRLHVSGGSRVSVFVERADTRLPHGEYLPDEATATGEHEAHHQPDARSDANCGAAHA